MGFIRKRRLFPTAKARKVLKMSDRIDIFEEMTLPLIALRGLVAFPAVQLNIEIVRPISLKAFTAAATMHDARVLLVAQKDIATEDPKDEDLYRMGVVAEIKHVVKNPHGNLSVIFEGLYRAKIGPVREENGYLMASVIAKKEKQSYKASHIPIDVDTCEFANQNTDEYGSCGDHIVSAVCRGCHQCYRFDPFADSNIECGLP